MRQTRLTWFIINGVIGVIFIIWGAITQNRLLLPGDIWLILPGILMFFIGVFGILEDIFTNWEMSKYLLSERSDNKSLDEIASALKTTVEKTKEIIFNLRAKGKLAKTFDSQTGFLISADLKNIQTCLSCFHSEVIGDFCPVCGTEMTQKPKDINILKK
ncbi:MAG: hypothetical protein JXA54_03310 [Candidatus Heimdallarchaeota archaeon]|nr:hypothetical protein [Candidatus Heimdallarchaeota archaeon]